MAITPKTIGVLYFDFTPAPIAPAANPIATNPIKFIKKVNMPTKSAAIPNPNPFFSGAACTGC